MVAPKTNLLSRVPARRSLPTPAAKALGKMQQALWGTVYLHEIYTLASELKRRTADPQSGGVRGTVAEELLFHFRTELRHLIHEPADVPGNKAIAPDDLKRV